MKTILFSIGLALTSLLLNAQNPELTSSVTTEAIGTTITVTVPMSSEEGSVLFGIYTEKNFLRIPLQGLESDITDGVAQVTFKNIIPGVYAITLFHDKNGNKQMDFDANGMPLEMYGVSNNVMSYGPPQWNTAKFEVATEPLALEIRM